MSTPSFLNRLLLLLILIGSGLAVGSATPVGADGRALRSSFNAGTEGWELWSLDASARHDPRGYLTVSEAENEPMWWSASPAFLGDRGEAYGGTIRVRLRDDRARGAQLRTPGLRLGGAGMELVLRARPVREPQGDWWTVRAELHDREGWYHSATGELATEGELRAVLGNLERLLVRSRLHRDARQADLDEVVLSYGLGAEVEAQAIRPVRGIRVTPLLLNFKNVYVGDFARRTLTVANTGTELITFRTPDLDPPFALVSHAEDLGIDVPPGQKVELVVEFRPDEAKAERQPAFVDFYFIDKLVKVDVRGTGKHPIEVTPKVLKFGKVALGKEKVLSLKVRNRSSLTFGVGTEFSAPSTSEWVLDQPSLQLPGGALKTVKLTFRPSKAQKYSNVLSFTFIGPELVEPPKIGVTLTGEGKGGAPAVEVAPSSLDFGELTTEETTFRDFEIRNLGTAPMKITLPAKLPAPFSWPKGGILIVGRPVTVEPLGVYAPAVVYTPTEVGQHSAQLVVQTSDPQHPTVTVQLSGKAVEPEGGPQLEFLDEHAYNTNFGFVPDGGFAERLITFKNVGTAPLEVYVEEVEAPFTVEPVEAAKVTVAPVHTGTISVYFSAAVRGYYARQFYLYTNIPGRDTGPGYRADGSDRGDLHPGTTAASRRRQEGREATQAVSQ